MPIVVNEIVFRGEIAAPSPPPDRAGEPTRPGVDRKALVEACVEEVLRVLERREER